MARPKKQTVDYFPHYVASGKTLFILENTFGNDGYAFWFKLLEILGSTEGHYYDTNNSADWRFLLAKTKVSEETGTEILKTLAELDAIDSDLWEQKVIWVQNLVDNVSDVYKKRGVAKPNKPSFCDRNPTTPIVSDSENPQSKLNQTKVKKTKGKETTIEVSDPHNLETVISHYCNKAQILETNINPKEVQAMISLLENIPVDTMILGIDEAFNKFNPKYPGDKIKSFLYCEPVIRALNAKHDPIMGYNKNVQKGLEIIEGINNGEIDDGGGKSVWDV